MTVITYLVNILNVYIFLGNKLRNCMVFYQCGIAGLEEYLDYITLIIYEHTGARIATSIYY